MATKAKVKTKRTSITVARKSIVAKKVEPKRKAMGSVVQKVKIQTAEGWKRTHAKR